MWCIAMFDLPTVADEERKRANQFRKVLLQAGFTMLQLSVYAQPFTDSGHCERIARLIRAELPPQGEVRLMYLTDKQFSKTEVFLGKKAQKPEKIPDQLLLF